MHDRPRVVLGALNRSKPAHTKGIFLKKVSVSSTMGLGVKVDPTSLSAQAQ
jgi:large subunit ribosomal protein L1